LNARVLIAIENYADWRLVFTPGIKLSVLLSFHPVYRYCDPVEETINLNMSTGVVTPLDCPTGYYCLVNTSASGDYPCPTGTYNNRTGLQTEGECEACAGGFYCETPGKPVIIIIMIIIHM